MRGARNSAASAQRHARYQRVGWKNNIRMDAGFYPGSGFQTAGDATTGAIRGRLEFGNRAGALKFVARFDHNSTELTLLKAQTTGTAAIHLQFDANNSLDTTR